MRHLLLPGFVLAALTLPAVGAAPEDGTAIYSGVCSFPGGRLGARILLTHAGSTDRMVFERFRGEISRQDQVTSLVIDRAAGRISFRVPAGSPVGEFEARDWSGTISDGAIRLDAGGGTDTDTDAFTLARVRTLEPPYPACAQI